MSFKLITKALKSRDMQRRLVIILMLLVLFRVLAQIPVPVGDPETVRQLIDSAFSQQDLFGFLNLLSGGALASFSIILLGLGPYINSSIIFQVLGKVMPQIKELQQEGESGRKKINQYTRILSVPLGIIQSIGIIFIIRQFVQQATGIDIIESASIFQWVLMVSSLVGGAVLLMWLGELITEQGVGNGISLLIFAGIITQLPTTINQIIPAFGFGTDYTFVADLPWIATGLGFSFELPFNGTTFGIVAAFTAVTIAVTYFVVKLNEAQRIITINYAKRVQGNRAYGGVNSILPVKLILAGVIPIIFAVAVLSVPSFAGNLLQNVQTEWIADFGRNLVNWFESSQSVTGAATGQAGSSSGSFYAYAYFAAIIMFTYLSTGLYFNAKDTAENLQKQGGFIPGIRPGAQTENYLKRVINRLNLFGSLSLAFIAILPFIAQSFLGNSLLTLGGTGLLIVVSVAIETLRQVESRALIVTYDND